MQTATSRAFAQGVSQLKVLLSSTKLAQQEAQARVRAAAPRHQALSRGDIWEVVDLGTGAIMGIAYRYKTAIVFVNVMEAAIRYNPAN